MGFQKEVNEIIKFLPPKEKRQTLLFSATIPNEVKAIMAATMKPNFVTADCIHDTDPASHTNKQVEQRHVIVPYKSRLVSGTVQLIWEVIQQAKAKGEPLKMVAFFNTANLVAFYASLFNSALDVPVLELHSRKSQSYRTKTADKFRAAKEAILFTSDVSARGVDYPGVTNVIQVGIADSRESYIHRLGRTGRAGKVGEGLLILYDVERKFLDKLDGIDVPVHDELQIAIDQQPDSSLMEILHPVLEKMRSGQEEQLVGNLESAYRSMLGFYNGKLSKQLGVKDPAILIDFVNEFAMQGGCSEIPGIETKTIGKMGLRFTNGLNITKNMSRQGGGGGRGGGGGANRNSRTNNREPRSANGNTDDRNSKPSPKRPGASTGGPGSKKQKTYTKRNGGDNTSTNTERSRRNGGGRGGQGARRNQRASAAR